MSARLLSAWWLAALIAAAGVVAVVPVHQFGRADDLGAQDDDEKTYGTEISTPLVGDYTNFAGLNPILIEGVGLVTGLNGTGGDPAPSAYRTALLEEMKKRGVKEPNQWLQSPNTALVIVRAYLPPTMKPGEPLDVEVIAPESAAVTSLAGGWLLETTLREHAIGGGQLLDGHLFAKAKGPILISPAASEREGRTALLRRGRVLGGATVLKKRELAVFLRNEYRSFRNATRISDAIGKRFHHFDQFGSKKPMAKALTDTKLALDIHPRYKDNYPRYLQVIRHIAFRETALNQRIRMQRLHDELLTPETADRAALQLEAIGKDSIPILKAGLKSPLLECRFHAAMALAYLEEPDAIPVLAEAARDERAFRVFALAGLSTLDDAQAHLALRELMSEPSAETRYGAFRALWTLDRNDPFIRGLEMGVEDKDDESTKKSNRGQWTLHVLQTEGEPMVHCTFRTRPEVVLFGADQQLSTPLALSAGPRIMITAQAGSETASITRFEPNQPDQRREVSLKLSDMLRAADELDATYPDVVQLLMQAAQQRNLPGRLESESLPESGRVYIRPSTDARPGRKATIGQQNQAPNIFPRFEATDLNSDADEDADDARPNGGGMASVTEDRTDDKSRGIWSFFNFGKKTAGKR
jgi:hypothetical protein